MHFSSPEPKAKNELTSYISVFVGLVIMNFHALFYLLMFHENNILITCWSFTLDR